MFPALLPTLLPTLLSMLLLTCFRGSHGVPVSPKCCSGVSSVVPHTRRARSSTLVVHTYVAPALVLRCSRVGFTLLPCWFYVAPAWFYVAPVVPPLFPCCPRVAFTSFARFGCEGETIDRSLSVFTWFRGRFASNVGFDSFHRSFVRFDGFLVGLSFSLSLFLSRFLVVLSRSPLVILS